MKETPHGVNGRFNVSRLSQSLPAIFHAWRSSRVSQHSVSNNYPGKSTNEDQISNDTAFASVTDKDATLRDNEVTNSKSFNTIMQCIQEDQAYSDIDDKGEYVQIVEQNGINKSYWLLEHGENQTADNPHGPPDHTNGKTLTQSLSEKQKHISPMYMEVIDNVSRGLVNSTISESGSEPEDNSTDVYSVPIDSIIDDSNAGEKVASPQTKMVTSKYQKRKSPITSRQNSSSQPTQQRQDINDEMYSTPLDSLPRITAIPSDSNVQDTAEEYSVPAPNEGTLKPPQNEQDYTSPVLATMAMNFNPSYNSVVKDDDLDGYCDLMTSKTRDSVFADAVANLQRNKQEKCKPPQPKPYKPQNPTESDKVFQSTSLKHNMVCRSHSEAETQWLPLHSTLGDYIMPGTNSMKLKSTMSCGVASDLYSVPIDSLNDEACDEDKLASSFNRGKVKPSSSKANSLANQQLNIQGSTSQSVQQDQDMYSIPVNAIGTNTDNMDGLNISIENDDKPPVPFKKKSESTDSPFAEAVASLQHSKQNKDKPSLPKPYRPHSRESSPSTLPNAQNLSVIDEGHGGSQQLLLQPATDDYIFPDNRTTLQTNDSLEYSYVIPDQQRIPNFIDDVCTDYTEC